MLKPIVTTGISPHLCTSQFIDNTGIKLITKYSARDMPSGTLHYQCQMMNRLEGFYDRIVVALCVAPLTRPLIVCRVFSHDHTHRVELYIALA